jgi:hypothetical protein
MATKADYYIATFETGAGAFTWRWEIRRHSRPMGVNLGATGFQTQIAAEQAGKQILAAFLEDVAREARRK